MATVDKKNRLTAEETQKLNHFLGFLFGMFSKYLLQANGYNVDYKVNGYSIEAIMKMPIPDIENLLSLAVKEERYEDAAVLKKVIDKNK